MTKKFRIWDKQDKSFFSEEYLKHFKVSISWDGQTIRQDFWGGTKIIGEDVFVQQWTGLIDSQGVEIYEGDIVEFDLSGDGERELALVEWHGMGWRAKTPNGNNVFIWYFNHKVVGNIFQTPELLEKCSK